MDISVIIPTYNRLWSLPGAIQSCLGTTCETEIIVVDDGSTDGTWQWLQEFPEIVKLKQSNLGKCWAANSGFNIAKGKYIKFLDSDDSLTPGSIDEQFLLIENEEADICVSGYNLIDEDNQILRSQPWIETDDYLAQFLGECDSSHYSAFLFKKSFIEKIPHRPDFAFRDDRLFVLEAVLKTPKISIHAGTALNHLKHSKERLQFNQGSQHIVQNYQHLNIYRRILRDLDQQASLTPRRKRAAIKILWPLANWMAKNDVTEGEQIYNWIRELDKTFVPPVSGFLKWMYRHLGFRRTQLLFKTRRILKYGLN